MESLPPAPAPTSSDSSSGIPSLPPSWRRGWRAATWNAALCSGLIYDSSEVAIFEGLCKWWRRASPASRSAAPGSDSGPPTSAGSGPTSGASRESAAPGSSSSRTSRRSSFAVPLKSLATLPLAGGLRSGMFSERRTWAHLTGARAGSASLLEEIAREESEGSTTWERGEYPTPSAARYGSSQNEGQVPHDRPSRGTPSLDTWAAKQWTTPIASEQNRSSGRSAGRRGRGISTDGAIGSTRAVLNPCFVEALQGFPVGWTDCAVLETPSSPRRPRSPSASSPKGSPNEA